MVSPYRSPFPRLERFTLRPWSNLGLSGTYLVRSVCVYIRFPLNIFLLSIDLYHFSLHSLSLTNWSKHLVRINVHGC